MFECSPIFHLIEALKVLFLLHPGIESCPAPSPDPASKLSSRILTVMSQIAHLPGILQRDHQVRLITEILLDRQERWPIAMKFMWIRPGSIAVLLGSEKRLSHCFSF